MNGIFRTILAANAIFAVILFNSGAFILAQKKSALSSPLIKCREFRHGVVELAALAADQGSIYFATDAGEIQARDASTAEVVWKSEIGGLMVSNIAFSEKHLFAASNPQVDVESNGGQTMLRMLSKTTGLTDKSITLPRQEALFIIQSQGFVFAASQSGWMAAFDAASGEKLWERLFPDGLSAQPSVVGGAAAIGTRTNEVVLIDIKTGSDLLSHKETQRLTAVAALESRQIVYGSERGRLERVDSDNKPSRWKFRAGGQISGIKPNGDRLLISSFDNFIYMVSPKGDLDWKKRLPGRPAENVLLMDGVGVVAISGDGSAIVFNSENGRTVNRIDFGDSIIESAISVGSHGIIFSVPGRILLYSTGSCAQL